MTLPKHAKLRKANCTSEAFEDFVQRSLNEHSGVFNCHIFPQVYYVFENGDYQRGKRLSRHILHFKSLQSEFPTLMARYGLQHITLGPKVHQGRQCHLIAHFSGANGGVLHDLVHPIPCIPRRNVCHILFAGRK